MPRARKTRVSLDATPNYNCTSCCVRRAFLCGEDRHSGRGFEHRRQWIEGRLLVLTYIYAIDIAAYAVMSNHYHVVLHVNRERGQNWSDAEVIKRWHRLFKGSMLSQRFSRGEPLDRAEQHALDEQAAEWRQRLISISWFMRSLNERIARDANREDNVTGRFWEGIFTTQALLDEKAVAACMVYVDLNPIRAQMALTPESYQRYCIACSLMHATGATSLATSSSPSTWNTQLNTELALFLKRQGKARLAANGSSPW